MRFGPPEAFRSELHPPPSFWSTSTSNQAPTPFLDDTPPHPHRATVLNANFDGTASASTVCSALRRRDKFNVSAPGKAVSDGSVGGRLRGGRSAGGRPRRRPRRGTTGWLPRSPQGALGDDAFSASAAVEDVSDSHGRFSPRTAVPPPKARECWGGGNSRRRHTSSPPPPPPKQRSPAPSPGEPRGGGERALDDSTTRVLMGGGCGHETEELDWTGEKEGPARAMSPGRKLGQARSGLIGGISPRSSSRGSPRKGAVGVGREGVDPEVSGFAFLKIQRELLKQLESLFVSIADDRRHALVALKREENEWKASARERARSDLRTAAAAGTDGATNTACSSDGGGGGGGGAGGAGLEERIRERIVEEGPGAAARRAVGLVRVGEGDDDGSDDGVGGDQTLWSMGRSRGNRRREQWRLPKAVVEEMRTEFTARMDQETAEVLEQENKALLEARAGIAAREGARTQRELRELSDRLANDGRDALTALRMELEAEEEARLAEERLKLGEAMAGSLQRERERLMTERKLAALDLRDEHGRESSRLAASLWEQAERSTAARTAEAVRLLDQAAERARVQLDALLQAQEERSLEKVRHSGSAKRKAAMKRAREEGERRCLEELKALAEGASKKNEAWLRMVVQDMRQALDDGSNAVGAGAGSGGGGEGQGEGGETDVAPALQLRAVEASEDCSRLGRRLVELVIKEALMRLRESGFDVSLRGEPTMQTTTTSTNGSSCNDHSSNNRSSDDDTGPQGVKKYKDRSNVLRISARFCMQQAERARVS
eukprot:g6160.t1